MISHQNNNENIEQIKLIAKVLPMQIKKVSTPDICITQNSESGILSVITPNISNQDSNFAERDIITHVANSMRPTITTQNIIFQPILYSQQVDEICSNKYDSCSIGWCMGELFRVSKECIINFMECI